GHCKNLKPDWEKAASHLKGVVNVAAVDATVSKNLASKFQIQVPAGKMSDGTDFFLYGPDSGRICVSYLCNSLGSSGLPVPECSSVFQYFSISVSQYFSIVPVLSPRSQYHSGTYILKPIHTHLEQSAPCIVWVRVTTMVSVVCRVKGWVLCL
ncbi:unnamed protein product, partial [Discosporangium mesarthrocarpum]